jgi:hypothetical protein
MLLNMKISPCCISRRAEARVRGGSGLLPKGEISPVDSASLCSGSISFGDSIDPLMAGIGIIEKY